MNKKIKILGLSTVLTMTSCFQNEIEKPNLEHYKNIEYIENTYQGPLIYGDENSDGIIDHVRFNSVLRRYDPSIKQSWNKVSTSIPMSKEEIKATTEFVKSYNKLRYEQHLTNYNLQNK